MNLENEQVTLLFSGGSDSTLAAFRLCNQFEKVHLITYTHSCMFGAEKSIVNTNKLAERFGKDKIVAKIIDIDKFWKEIYCGAHKSDFRKYKTYLAACGCGACKIAMHTRTIIYNLENGIRVVADGTNKESSNFFPAQMRKVIERMKLFSNEYGITYITPVYEESRTDWKLHEIGLSSAKNKKFPYEYQVHDTQGGCYNGDLHNIYVRFYLLPFIGLKTHVERAIEYYREKTEVCRKYIQNYFDEKSINVDFLVKKMKTGLNNSR